MRLGSKVWVIAAVVVIVVGGAILSYFLFLASPYSSVQGKQIGANVSVSGGKVPNRIKAKQVKTNAGWTPFTQTQPLTPAIEVTPSGPLPAPITLRFKMNRQVTADDIVLIATSEKLSGSWTLIQPSISRDGWYASTQVNHLSIFTTLFSSLKQAVEAFKSNFLDDGITGDLFTQAEQPTCANEDQARQDDYTITSSAKDTVYWCFGVENGSRILKVVSRVRYPLEISTSNLAIQNFTGPRFGQLNSLGADDILYPFDEVDYAVSDLTAGQKAVLDTAYAGLAQSIYAMQIGVTTLLSLVDFFGEGGGIAIGGGRLSKTAFDTVSETMDKFLGIANCLNAFSKKSVGAVISGCFSPADILDTFGWKGLLLAPIMAVSDVLTFFQSEIASFVGLLQDQDKYAIIISRFDLAPYVGEWGHHDYGLTINADGTGTDYNYFGFSPECGDNPAYSHGTLTITPESGYAIGVYTSVTYDACLQPSPDDQRAGDSFKLTPEPDDRLLVTYLGRQSSWDPLWLCGPNAPHPDNDPCGA